MGPSFPCCHSYFPQTCLHWYSLFLSLTYLFIFIFYHFHSMLLHFFYLFFWFSFFILRYFYWLSFFLFNKEIVPEPVGVVLVIGPWNYPVQLIFNPLIASISAGNCTAIKVSFVSILSLSFSFLYSSLPSFFILCFFLLLSLIFYIITAFWDRSRYFCCHCQAHSQVCLFSHYIIIIINH